MFSFTGMPQSLEAISFEKKARASSRKCDAPEVWQRFWRKLGWEPSLDAAFFVREIESALLDLDLLVRK